MAYTLGNWVRSVLVADAAAASTTLSLAKAAAPLKDPPAASVEAPGVLVLIDTPAAPTKIEVVTYTDVSIVGNTVTLTGVLRGQEGTTAADWIASTPTYQGMTVAVLEDIRALAGDASKLGGQLPAHYLSWANMTDVPVTFPPASHAHDASDVTTGRLDNARLPTAITVTTLRSTGATTSAGGFQVG